jgi:hypothetical protein
MVTNQRFKSRFPVSQRHLIGRRRPYGTEKVISGRPEGRRSLGNFGLTIGCSISCLQERPRRRERRGTLPRFRLEANPSSPEPFNKFEHCAVASLPLYAQAVARKYFAAMTICFRCISSPQVNSMEFHAGCAFSAWSFPHRLCPATGRHQLFLRPNPRTIQVRGQSPRTQRSGWPSCRSECPWKSGATFRSRFDHCRVG